MLKSLTNVNVWVTNQDEAADFYTGKLGMEIKEDVTLPEMGNFRWLTVGLPGDSTALALLEIPGPPVFDADTRDRAIDVVARGAAGGLFFSVDDIQATFADLSSRGVEFTQEPTQQPYGIDAGLRDPFGNQIRIAEMGATA